MQQHQALDVWVHVAQSSRDRNKPLADVGTKRYNASVFRTRNFCWLKSHPATNTHVTHHTIPHVSSGNKPTCRLALNAASAAAALRALSAPLLLPRSATVVAPGLLPRFSRGEPVLSLPALPLVTLVLLLLCRDMSVRRPVSCSSSRAEPLELRL